MIDPKELHIGSHTLVDGKRERVRGLDEDNGLIIRFPAEYVLASDVDPIPITEELLRELGFEYRDNTYWERWFLGGFDIERKDGSKYFDYNSEIRLEYLHELETLYYLIYGQELIKE